MWKIEILNYIYRLSWYLFCIGSNYEKGTMMYETGIFEGNKGGYFWADVYDDSDYPKARYFVDDDTACMVHNNIKSALYDDMTGYVDELQCEESLNENELYVVLYYKAIAGTYDLDQLVDFGLTKQEIIDNVRAQKYVEGANYYTMGNMFYSTRVMLERLKS